MKKYVSLDTGTSKDYFGSRRQGGISNIPKVILKHYFNYISGARQRIDDKNWLKSIK
jgi:hypothetical protein